MGLAGVYLPMVYTGTFTQGITAGRGWLSSALTFFGGWQPQFIFAGSFLFAVVDVLASRAQVAGTFLPHQFLRMLPYVVTLLTMIFAVRWARVPAFLGKNYDREKRSV
jgi:simple sugar transport system permease protein